MKRRIRKKTVQIVTTLILALVLAVPSLAYTNPSLDDSLLRVGLYYGSSALTTANLENVSGCGSGYRFGYFDSDLNFIELGYTDQTTITMLKTHNIYLTSSNGYSTTPSSYGVVGCYHVQLSGNYSDFSTAKSVADSAGGFVAWINGTYYVRVGSYTSASAASSAASAYSGATVGETSSSGISVTQTGTTNILFQFDDQGSGTGLGVQPDTTGSSDVQTWFKGYKYRGAFRYQRVSGGDLTVVNVVPLGDYIKGVVPYEMSPSWPLEALKAQAVCARTYALSNLNKHKSYGFDICTSTDCQVYHGTNSENSTTIAAVEETAGVTVKYNGAYAQTVFSASDGGATESSENVWTEAIPYLRGVVDPYEASVADLISNYNWTSTYTGEELQAKLVAKGFTSCGVITAVSLTKTETGNVYSMTFTDVNGKNWTVYKENCRTYFGFQSMRFDLADGSSSGGIYVNGSSTGSVDGMYAIDSNGNKSVISGTPYVITGSGTQQLTGTGNGTSSSSGSSGTFTFQGTGNGHNVGMSQWGAYAMAQQGFDYVDILTFYYTGVTVE